MRIRHWIKNLFVFAPLVFSLRFLEPMALLSGSLAAMAFCFISSFCYIINDIADKEKDRLHPGKKDRPVASGKLSPVTALVFAMIVLAAALAVAFCVSWQVAAAVAGYVVLSLCYSFFLKHLVITDVVVIAIGFLVRIIAGALAVGVVVSNWLLLSALFIALFLGFGKRRHDMMLLANGNAHRPVLEHYTVELLNALIIISVTLSVITYSLYTLSADTISRFHTNCLIYTVPLVVYGIFRYMYIIFKKDGGGDPAEVVLGDKNILVVIMLWGVSVISILYLGYIGLGVLP